jgi:class 3 adenylate cyclase
MDDLTRQRLNTLILLYEFERLWGYYSTSEGELYPDEIWEVAERAHLAVSDLVASDPKLAGSMPVLASDVTEQIRFGIEDAIPGRPQSFEKLANKYFVSIVPIRIGLMTLLGSEVSLNATHNPEQFQLYETRRKWQPHLPRGVFQSLSDPDGSVTSAFDRDAIVIVGDIRNSQDLMTYAESPQDFRSHMLGFIDEIRVALGDYEAIFDKFTGDGFIAYLSDGITRTHHAADDRFCQLIDRLTKVASRVFAEWVTTVRKVPHDEIGLALGADIGKIDLRHEDGHLIAVGDAIVWATRMAAVAKAGETLCNNRLAAALRHRRDISLEERKGSTKSGEAFLARALTFTTGEAGLERSSG